MLLQWLFLQIERYELKLRVHWKIKLLRDLYWNYMLDSIEITLNKLLWLFLIDFCVYNGKQYQQGQSWYDGCSYKCTCEDAEKGVYRCLSRSVSQSHRILVFWLLDCKLKVYYSYKQTFCMSLKEGILFIFFLTLYHWGFDVSDGLSN